MVKYSLDSLNEPENLLTLIKEVDGTTSGLDADTVDSIEAAAMAQYAVTGSFTAVQTFTNVTETVTSKAVSFTPNLTTEGTVFKVTATATVTMPTASAGKSFVIVDTGAFISGWGASPAIRWIGGAIPTYTSIAYFVFSCTDGTNWDGIMAGGDYATV